MSSILSGITQKSDFKKQNRLLYINAVIMMGIFTFLFLGAEYLFDNMISLVASEEKTVLAQNYVLGVSTAGFLLYPLFNCYLRIPELWAVSITVVAYTSQMKAITESLYISRRTLEQYISSIYEKTGVKSRVGLIRIFNEK